MSKLSTSIAVLATLSLSSLALSAGPRGAEPRKVNGDTTVTERGVETANKGDAKIEANGAISGLKVAGRALPVSPKTTSPATPLVKANQDTGTGGHATVDVSSVLLTDAAGDRKLQFDVDATFQDKTNYFGGAETIRMAVGLGIRSNSEDGHETFDTAWLQGSKTLDYPAPKKQELVEMKRGEDGNYRAHATYTMTQTDYSNNVLVGVRYAFGIPAKNLWDSNESQNYLAVASGFQQ